MNKAEIEAQYITHEQADTMVLVRLEGGKVDMFTYLCNEVDDSESILNAVTAWADDVGPVAIVHHFTVASPVDYLIESYQMPAHNNDIDKDAKPIFDALRAEMLAQIARMDALVFA